MKKILYFTITYTSIALFMISLLGPNNNFWLWLAIGITLLTLPIIVSKLLKDNYNISKELIIAICTLLFLSISALVLNSKEPKYDLIAITSDLQKASDIQKLLGLENPSISQYIFDEKGELVGQIVDYENYGASDILTVLENGHQYQVPFILSVFTIGENAITVNRKAYNENKI